MPPKLNVDNLKTDTFKTIGFDPQSLVTLKPIVLSDNDSARKLGVSVRDLNLPLVLSANKPLVNKSFLSFYSPMMLIADPRDSNNIALFSSAYFAFSNPSMSVEFYPLKPGKKHLVEFGITINEPAKVYKFRVIKYPASTSQDISISGTQNQTIDIIIDTDASSNFSYGASINQLNTKADACGWIFHSVKITSIN